MIDERAIIDPSAKISDDASISAGAYIGKNVVIGAGTSIGPYAVIEKNTTIGKNNKISQFASIGGDPQHESYQGEETFLEIGDNNLFREFCSIHRGTVDGGAITRIGNNNFFMTYAHVAHDCQIGHHTVISHAAAVAGHVTMEDYAGLSAYSGVHQFCCIGTYSFIGRAAKVVQDVLPYALVIGNPGVPVSINLIGLRRGGFNLEIVRALKKAFLLVNNFSLSLEKIKIELQKMANSSPEVQLMVDAFEKSKRGIARSKAISEEVEA